MSEGRTQPLSTHLTWEDGTRSWPRIGAAADTSGDCDAELTGSARLVLVARDESKLSVAGELRTLMDSDREMYRVEGPEPMFHDEFVRSGQDGCRTQSEECDRPPLGEVGFYPSEQRPPPSQSSG